MQVVVRGRNHQWGFIFSGDTRYLKEWQDDGLDVAVIENVVPTWVPGWAIRAWCAAQDFFNFRRGGR